MQKLSDIAEILVIEKLKKLLEEIDNSIKICGACADEKGNLSAKAKTYFNDQVDVYKNCRQEVIDLVKDIKNA